MFATSSFVEKPDKTCYEGEDTDETILYVIRASLLTTLPWLFLFVVMLGVPFVFGPLMYTIKVQDVHIFSPLQISAFSLFWYVLAAAYIFQNYVNWFYNVYIVSNKKIMDMDFKGILYKNISETTLDNIQDTTSNVRGALGIIFNVGDVYIQTAAESREFEFSKVDDPAKVRDIISDLAAIKIKENGNP